MVNLFKLPIYNCPPKQIYEKYFVAREKRVCELVERGWERNRAIDLYSHEHSKKIDPDNYIIGYLYIDFNNGCFEYRLGLCRKPNSSRVYNMPLYTSTKHYMQVHHVNGVYDCPHNMSNSKIASMIKESIEMICANDLDGAYCDLDSFYRINRYINYNALLAEIK